jgi:hypothetical protein
MDDAFPDSASPSHNCPAIRWGFFFCGFAWSLSNAVDLSTFGEGGQGERWSQVRRDERVAEMLKMARELAAHGHRMQMIEAVLAANGYPEAADFIDQPHIRNELRDIALTGRREEAERSIIERPSPKGR